MLGHEAKREGQFGEWGPAIPREVEADKANVVNLGIAKEIILPDGSIIMGEWFFDKKFSLNLKKIIRRQEARAKFESLGMSTTEYAIKHNLHLQTLNRFIHWEINGSRKITTQLAAVLEQLKKDNILREV